jgi:hypothetical protein
MNRSKTQTALLAAIAKHAAAARETEADADAAAIGGLSDFERLEREGVYPSGTYVPGGSIPGLSTRTYEALVESGDLAVTRGVYHLPQES